MAKGYVIAQVDVHDPAGYAAYSRLVHDTVAAYDGRYIVRGGDMEVVEGEKAAQRLVVIEFESVARAREWYSSPEYRHPKEIRQRTASTHLIIVEGT